MPILSSVMWNGVPTTGIYNGIQVWGGMPAIYNITLQTDGHGTISADALSGYTDDVITLSQTANSNYTFSNYTITGATLTGSQFRIENSDVTAQANYTQNVYTLTLQNDGHGTIAASKTTGHAGDTVTLSNTYNTYYRFNNYTQTGGSLNGSTFTFGSQNATAKANFKVNAFTASGGFEKGSNVGPVTAATNIGAKYAVTSYHTSNVPTAWYNTSNRWKVTSTVSAYKITLAPKMRVTATRGYTSYSAAYAYATATTLIGSTQSNTQTFSKTGKGWGTTAFSYAKSFTASNTGVNYGVSGKMQGAHNSTFDTKVTYVAAGTSGTWTATGYIP